MAGTTQTTRSIFGVDPVDEFAVQVSEWIWQHGQGLLNLEIEAKIGLLIDRKTNARDAINSRACAYSSLTPRSH